MNIEYILKLYTTVLLFGSLPRQRITLRIGLLNELTEKYREKSKVFINILPTIPDHPKFKEDR